MVVSSGFQYDPEKVTTMSRYNLSDIQSSTVLYASDSVNEVIDVVQTLIDQDGPDALAGLSLGVRVHDSGAYMEFENTEILHELKSRKTPAHA